MSATRPLYPGGLGMPGLIGYIQMSEIQAYTKMLGIGGLREFIAIIRHMDKIYVTQQNEKLTACAKNK